MDTTRILAAVTIAVATLISAVAHGRTAHDPIVIEGDADFTAANGVIAGTGTGGDPYLIAGWTIDAWATGYGIVIRDTTAWFFIRDVEVVDAWMWWGTGVGILLDDVTHGEVGGYQVEDEVLVSGCDVGVELRRNDASAVVGVVASGNGVGIEVDGGQGCLIANNEVVDNRGTGIRVRDEVRHITVSYNHIAGNDDGLVLDGGYGVQTENWVHRNIVEDQYYTGIYAHGNEDLLIENNHVLHNWDGIVLDGTDRSGVSLNHVEGHQGTGIDLWGAYCNIVGANNLIDNGIQGRTAAPPWFGGPECGPHNDWNAPDAMYCHVGNHWSDHVCEEPYVDECGLTACADPVAVRDTWGFVREHDEHPLQDPFPILLP